MKNPDSRARWVNSPSCQGSATVACGYIYLLTFRDGKHYVGLTRDFTKRLKFHRYYCWKLRTKNKLYRGWRRVGLESAAVIFSCSLTDLPEFETHFIAEYDSYDSGYNSTRGAGARLRLRNVFRSYL